MSVLIKGMDMPTETYTHCMLVKDINGAVQLHVCTKNSEDISEWEYYDLVPVAAWEEWMLETEKEMAKLKIISHRMYVEGEA